MEDIIDIEAVERDGGLVVYKPEGIASTPFIVMPDYGIRGDWWDERAVGVIEHLPLHLDEYCQDVPIDPNDPYEIEPHRFLAGVLGRIFGVWTDESSDAFPDGWRTDGRGSGEILTIFEQGDFSGTTGGILCEERPMWKIIAPFVPGEPNGWEDYDSMYKCAYWALRELYQA